jgi:LmbE family N-acetylglucosaminyl deacetylase
MNNTTAPPRLLGIFAHPDDESFGSGGALAKYAHQGVDVHVCTVTDGAAGVHNSDAPQEGRPSLAQLRRQELICACRVLGARLHTLDYRDSGMAGSADNTHPDSLHQADLAQVARDLVRVIRQVRPQVILTHDPSGGYFHPDHVKVSRAVGLAWGQTGDATWQPARLYHTAIPRSTLKWFIRILRLLRQDPTRFGQNQDIDLTQVGVPDEQIHVRLDVGPWLEIKEQASACHQSQGGGGAASWLPKILRHRLLRHEHFVQALPAGAFPHDDLFEFLHPPN